MQTHIKAKTVVALLPGSKTEGWVLREQRLTGRRGASVGYERILVRIEDNTYWRARYTLTPVVGHVAEYAIGKDLSNLDGRPLLENESLRVDQVFPRNETTINYRTKLERRIATVRLDSKKNGDRTCLGG